MPMQFRDYQKEIIIQGIKKLSKLRIIMLAMEVRTGKTLTSLGIASHMNIDSVLFITKKKAISSIEKDYNLLQPNYPIKVINFESVHKVDANDYDLVIVDESHSLGAFPKPSLRTKRIKEIVANKYCILLTGTPTPESWSQIYHQFWISQYSPFPQKSFYGWAKGYVNVTKRKINGYDVNDYSNANYNLIRQKVSKHIISFSQSEAGFTSKVNEHILHVTMKPSTYELVRRVEKDLVYEGVNGGVILADTPIKMMQKVHQIYSGTIKLEDGTSTIIDDSKGVFIKNRFKDKIAIFYKFKEELKLLQSVFGDRLTTSLNEFNKTDKNIALQIVSGREGISLSKAKYLVYFNIDFSATSYWQSRDRLTTKERMQNDVYWIFSKGGLEDKIYKQVQDKKSFTTTHYDRSKVSKQDHQRVRS